MLLKIKYEIIFLIKKYKYTYTNFLYSNTYIYTIHIYCFSIKIHLSHIKFFNS